jgi:hypothetical protein
MFLDLGLTLSSVFEDAESGLKNANEAAVWAQARQPALDFKLLRLSPRSMKPTTAAKAQMPRPNPTQPIDAQFGTL